MDGKIQGFIRDASTNMSIPSGWVTAINTDYGAVSYTSPFGGHYTLHLSAGTYDIVCDAEGYQEVIQYGVTVVDGGTMSINFYLYPTDLGGQSTEMLTGIGESSFETLSVYPNPAKEEVNISANTLIGQVKIINNMGQLVFDQMVNETSILINTQSLLNGVYFVEIHTSQGVSTEKLIIE
jgi:hypothetical protein